MEKNIDVAKDIKISESTLAIIQCRAKICDINNELAEALESEYPEMEIAKMMEGYYDCNDALDQALMKLLSGKMALTMINTGFKEM